MLTAVTTLVTVILALVGAVLLPNPMTRTQGAVFAGVAVVLGVYSFCRVHSAWPRPVPGDLPVASRSRHAQHMGWALVVVGAGLLAWALLDIWIEPFVWNQAGRWMFGLVAMLAGAYLVGHSSTELGSPERQVGFAVTLAAVAPDIEPISDADTRPLSPVQTKRATRNGVFEPHMPNWLMVSLLMVILLVAVWLRVYRINEMPPGIFIDETNAALDGLRILEGRADSPFGTGWFETPNGFVYLQTLFFRLFGTTFLAIKLQSLLPGILTVLAVFLLARELLGSTHALFAAAFLAFNRWHVNMSRWGWNEVYPPLMQLLALFFIERASRRRSLGDWAMAGFLLGLGMYTYLAMRLVVLAIAMYLGYRVLVQRGFLRRNWQGLILMAVLYAMTLAPLSFTYAKHPFTFLNRSEQVSILNDIEAARGDLQPLWESASRHAQMFLVAGDRNPRHNLAPEPMLDPVTGAFFLLGLVWAVWRWRDHRHGLLVIWMAVILLGGILSRLYEAPQAYRTLAVTPAVAILAADAYGIALRGLVYPVRRMHLWRWLWAVLAIVGFVVAGWLNYDLYFNRQANDADVYIAFSPLETTVAREALAKRDDYRLYLSPRLYYFSPLRFFTYQPTHAVGVHLGPLRYSPFNKLGGGLDQPGYQLADPALDLPLADQDGESALFLLDPHFQYLLDSLRYYYPRIEAELVSDRLGRPLYLSVTIPGNEIAALQASNRAADATELRGLAIPHTGDYRISPLPSKSGASTRVELDGRVLDSATVTLGQGLHGMRLLDLPADLAPDAPLLEWEGPAGFGVVPDRYLFRKPPGGNGLQGTYYRGSEWAQPVFMQRIDPMLVAAWPEDEPMYGPFSVTWTGELLAPVDGVYQIQINADDGARLWLDGRVLAEGMAPDTANVIRTSVKLTVGPHPIRIDYFQRGGGKSLEFFWQPPGLPMQPVSARYLRPADS